MSPAAPRAAPIPAAAAVTLVAGADGYALVRDGNAAAPPLRRGLTLAAAAAMIAA